MIPAAFLIPNYDITFSDASNINRLQFCRRCDGYADFRLVSAKISSPMRLFGGTDYIPLFYRLTANSADLGTVF